MGLIDRFLGFPNTLIQLIQALSWHPAKVVHVKDPTGSGRVQVASASLGIKESYWIQVTGNHVGNDDKSRKHTGLWAPAQPGQYGYVFYPGGNLLKPIFMAGNVTMNDKGNAG